MPFSGIANFIQAAGSSWLCMSGLALVLALGVAIIGWALLEEARLKEERRDRRRHAFADRRQSRSVYLCTRRLSSPRRSSRVDAVQILRQLNDPTALPALLKALERYNRDVPFAILVAETLGRFGDTRALSTLRPLTTGRDYRLMQTARQATQIIEAKSVLLRPSHEPPPQEQILLRAAQPGATVDAGVLLRAGETPG